MSLLSDLKTLGGLPFILFWILPIVVAVLGLNDVAGPCDCKIYLYKSIPHFDLLTYKSWVFSLFSHSKRILNCVKDIDWDSECHWHGGDCIRLNKRWKLNGVRPGSVIFYKKKKVFTCCAFNEKNQYVIELVVYR